MAYHYSVGLCSVHHKRLYTSRDSARKAIRVYGRHHCRPYRCTANPRLWHWGHMPENIMLGRVTASEVYRDAS